MAVGTRRTRRAVLVVAALCGPAWLAGVTGARSVEDWDGATVTAVAGRGGRGFSGDGGPATSARLSAPRTMAVGPAGDILLVDTENHRVRRVNPAGVITTIAGTGSAGYSGDGGPATRARLNLPHGIALDAAGTVYVADAANHRVRRIGADGIITTVAGTGTGGFNGDGRPATTARLRNPKGVEVGPDGLLLIADSVNHRVRRIGADGIITTVAGTGTAGFSGDGGPATAARLYRPRNVAFDGSGAMLIVDERNNRLRRVSPSGVITTFAGTGAAGYNGDNRPATTAALNMPADVAVDAAGSVFIAEDEGDRIRRVAPGGIITTVVGTGVRGYNGDNRLAPTAQVAGPRGVAVDGVGRVLVADTGNHRIRRVA